MPQRLWLFVLSLLLAIGFVACRNPGKKQSPADPSPTPAARVATGAPTPSGVLPTQPAPTVVPATTVPVKTIQVTPPATFSAEQLPAGQPGQFIVQGNAGQFLRVKVKLGRGEDPTNSVSAQYPGTSRPLEAVREGGDCSGNFIYRLPETGAYPVELNSAGRNASIAFTLLDGDDPMVDPGIKAEQISLDAGTLAPGEQMKLEPFGQWEGCIGNWEPSHWSLTGKAFQFQIMQVAGYEKAARKGSEDIMKSLEAAIQRQGKGVRVEQLPYQVFDDEGLNLATRPTFIEGQGWRGLRWIGDYAQDSGCGFTDLSYVFEGLSTDNRFFMVMWASTSNPEVSRRLDQKCAAGPKGRGFDEFFKTEMPVLFNKEVSVADAGSFNPSLDQLDAVIRSLKLKP